MTEKDKGRVTPQEGWGCFFLWGGVGVGNDEDLLTFACDSLLWLQFVCMM